MRNNFEHKLLFSIIVVLSLLMMVGVCYSAETLQKGEPIVIGAPIPKASPHGQQGEKAMILAVDEINAAGGVNLGGSMHPFKLEIIDTRDHEPGVPTSDVLLSIEKLILSKKPHITIGGPNMSESAVVAMDLFAKHKVVHIHSIGGWTPAWQMKVAKNPELYKYVFKIAGNVIYWMKEVNAIIQYIKETHKLNKMFIAIGDAAHCRAAAKIVGKVAVKNGWEIVGKEIHPLGTTDYSMLMRRIKKTGAQLVFAFDHTPEALKFQKQWYELQVPAIPIGLVDSVPDPGMWNKTKGKVAYLISVGGEAGTIPDQNITPLTKHFFEAFSKKWGEEPGVAVCSPSYFGVYMIKDMIERTQSLDPAKLIPAIENVDMMTITGRLRFNKKNHQAIYGDDPKENLLSQYIQWQNGKRMTVWPKSIANADIQMPPWMKK